MTVYVPDGFQMPTTGPGQSISLVQGDYQKGTIEVVGAPSGGKITVNTNIPITEWREYRDGILRAGGRNFTIDSNTAGENCQVTVFVAPGGPPPLGLVELFQDDFQAAGNAYPSPRRNADIDEGFYDLLDSTKFTRIENPFLDAYIEPNWIRLDAFDSSNVTPTSHAHDALPANSPAMPEYYKIADPFRGPNPRPGG